MRAYDATCPHCGHRNIDMYLEETEGWMDCENCGKLHEFTQFRRGKRLPVYRMDAIPMEILHPERMKAGVAAV